MKSFWRHLIAAMLALLPFSPAYSAGTTPLAMAIQSDINGKPLSGCLLYFFVAGTVATPQNAFQDFGLTQPLPNPITCDQAGRVGMHWLADGLIHLRLTDAAGNGVIDTTMQVLGPSSGGGGGGGGGTVDPTTIASTGDVKARFSNETLVGWVVMNGTTIGSSTSGATQRANADTQNLYVYLWTNCSTPASNLRCPVAGGLGVSALADFSANKAMGLPDMRDTVIAGRDCMQSTCKGVLLASNMNAGPGVDGANGSGGAANIGISQANLPSVTFPANNSYAPGTLAFNSTNTYAPGTLGSVNSALVNNGTGPLQINTASAVSPSYVLSQIFTALPSFTPAGNVVLPSYTPSIGSGGSGTQFATMPPFRLATYYIKL